MAIVTQLLQVIEAMHSPEEMFQWLASVIVQCFDVSIVQFWTRESGSSGQPSAQLQAMACQDLSLPASVISEKVTMTVEHISREQRIFPPQMVEQVFPHFQAALLKRYGVSYCSCCLIDRNVCFAPVEYALAHAGLSTGLMFIVLLFLRRYPHQDLMPTISIILEQAVGIAENRHLLLPVAAGAGHLSLSQEASPQEPLAALLGLIPRLKQDARLLVSNNPFASSVTISDKQTLRLYTTIDGRKTVDELYSSTGMTLKEGYVALQTLLNLQYVEMYTPQGQLVDIALLFEKR